MSRADVLVSAEALAAALADEEPPALLDVRWALGRSDGHEQYLAAHLPGAVFVDLDTEARRAPERGRRPAPAPAAGRPGGRGAALGAARRGGGRGLRRHGGTAAARAWWLLRWAGVAHVRLLDGGLSAWTAAGLSLEAGEVLPEPGDVVLHAGGLPTIDAEGAAAWPESGTLLDARAAERYAGLVEPVDPRAGHIPGARSAPTADNLAPDGRFLDDDALRARFAAVGGTGPVAVYCGSGVTAAHEVAALAAVGIEAALYPGSWSQWSSDPSRPVATSPEQTST